MVNRQEEPAQNRLPNIPTCYRDLDHWKQSVAAMIQAKKDSGRLAYTAPEKVAIVELLKESGMLRTHFQWLIMGSEGGTVITRMTKEVDQMEKNNTLPPPWRPQP